MAASFSSLVADRGSLPQGEPAEAVYAIVGGTGLVRVGSSDQESHALMVQVFLAGDLFGEIAVLDHGSRTAEAVTEGPVILLRISAFAFIAVLEDTPSLGANLCRVMAGRLRRTSILLQDATFYTVEARLARQVLYLAELYGHQTSDGRQLGGRFRERDLADLLGTTPRSIITTLNKWRADGVVKYDTRSGRLTICDEMLLQASIPST